ncbi:MAG: presenilin family intramembrane aspartyl protease [Candidatus Pacearchaeota archaeon]|nr:presenilin family intramembrane aspartyl protease [Candidatus Pacearchaeota archaeon]
MKHSWKITLILLAMFFIAQLLGLAVINAYSNKTETFFNSTTNQYENKSISQLPPAFQLPQGFKPIDFVPSLIISFVLAIILIFILMRFKFGALIKVWFFIVVIIALGLAFNALLKNIPVLQGELVKGAINYSFFISLIIAIPLAIFKIYKRNMLVHNLTELIIYPGIATVFVPILSTWTAIILLLIISVYDIYAVWHSGFMQKMAKYHINKLNIFPGFFLPNADQATKEKIKLLREKYKNNIPDKVARKQKLKINLAILGGGDVVFPIIFAGVILIARGLLPALAISVFASIALFLLFIFARKGKFYPAMPFLTAGCLLGFLVGLLF